MEPTQPFQRQLAYIAGEAVSFMPTGLPKQEDAIVQFDDFYKPPGLSPSDSTLLKKTMLDLFSSTKRPVFDPASDKELDKRISGTFLPPCDEYQKNLVLQSLQYRFDLLRMKLNSLGIRSFQDLRRRVKELEASPSVGSVEGRDSMEVRQNLKHFQALKQLIGDYEKEQQCVNLEDKAFGEIELDLTDSRVRELLRQFIFFTLQAHHPLEDYKKTSPTAPAFVKKLEVNPLGDKFPAFLTTYQANKLPIPETIARVLDAIDKEGGVLDKEVQSRVKVAIDQEKTKILIQIKRIFPDGDPFWRTLKGETDLSRILDRMLEYYKEAKAEVIGLQAANSALEAKIKQCNEMKAICDARILYYQGVLSTAEKQRDDALGKLATSEEQRRALEEASREYETRKAALLADLQRLTEERDRNLRRINQLLETGEGLADQVARLQTEVNRLKLIEETADANISQLREQHAQELQREREKTAAETKLKDAAETSRKKAEEQLAIIQADLGAKALLIQTNERTITNLKAARKVCEDEKQILQSNIASKTSEIAKLSQEKAQLANEKAALEETLSKQAETTAEVKEETERAIQGMTDRIQELSADLNDILAKLKECEDSKKILEAKVDEPTLKLAEIQAKLSAMESNLAAATQEKARLEEEVRSLKEEALLKEEAALRSKDELDAKILEAKGLQTRAESAEKQVTDLQEAIKNEQDKGRQKDDALVAQSGEHEQRIKTLTDDFKAQMTDQISKTEAEKSRADIADGLVKETKELIKKQEEATQILQDAIQELVRPGASREALSAVEDAETKETLALILRKLEASSRSSSPSSAERRTDNLMNQCYNVMLLTYLWQTNFPPGDADSQALLSALTLLFWSGEYPGTKQRFSGVYGGNTLMIQAYLPLLLKLLTLFSVEGQVSDISSVTLTDEEIAQIEKLSNTIRDLEKAEVAASEKGAGAGSSLSISTGGEASFLLNKARENLLRLNPQLKNRIPYEYIVVKKDRKEAAAVIGTPSKLSFPLVLYCFMIVLRDHLNHQKSSFSRCPLPAILKKA